MEMEWNEMKSTPWATTLDFEQMKNNFNINSIEESEQMSFFRHRNRSSEREKRERREDDKNVKRDTRNDARNNVVKNDVENDVTDETNVLMKNVF